MFVFLCVHVCLCGFFVLVFELLKLPVVLSVNVNVCLLLCGYVIFSGSKRPLQTTTLSVPPDVCSYVFMCVCL